MTTWAGAPPSERAHVLVFELGPKRLGLRAEDIVEVVRAVAVAAVPKGPAILEGAINYRGRVVPVLDVRARMQVPPRRATPDQHLIVARLGGRLVALRVDRALDLLEVDASRVDDPALTVPGAELAAGVIRLDSGVLIVHDLARFLSDVEGRAVDAAVAIMEQANRPLGGEGPVGRGARVVS